MLHYLDDLDSKMEAMRAHFEREAEMGGHWTGYNASLGRPLLDSRKFIEGEKAPANEARAEGTAIPAAAPAGREPASPDTPVLDLFSEQKA